MRYKLKPKNYEQHCHLQNNGYKTSCMDKIIVRMRQVMAVAAVAALFCSVDF